MEPQNTSQSLSFSPLPPEQPPLKKPKMSSTTTTTSDDDTATKRRRYKRRKVAIFFAYCGVGYQGMQKNPGAKTIEGDLEEALYFSGAVPDADRGQPKRFDWARSARTDKGVSAVGQVVSGRFYVDPPGFIQRLNSNLSPQIKVFGYKRVTHSFNAKKFCDRRRYVYLLPVFALDPTCHRDRESVLASLGSGDNELVKCVECSERGRKVVGLMGNRRDWGSRRLGSGLGISSNSCDPLISSNVNVGGGGGEGGGDDLGNVEGLRNDVGVVDSEGCVQSGSSSNICAALVSSGQNAGEERVKDSDDALRNGEALKNDVGGVNSEGFKNGDASLISEKEGCNVSVESKNEAALLATDVKEEEMFDVVRCGDDGEGVLEEAMKGKRSEFKYGEDEKKRFNRILKYYEGTHNFHNFTTRTKAEDPSAKRYIVSFEANTTLMIEGIEFVKCEVIGQSFMLHQIRKMIGMAVAVMRDFVPESIYERAFDQEFHINVPTAPEVGLYLDECLFTSYNNKWRDTHEEISMNDYAEEAEEFKLKYIYSHIAKTEHKEGSVAVWLHSLNHRNYPDFRPPTDGVENVADDAVERVAKEVESVAKDGGEKGTSGELKRVVNDEVKRAAEQFREDEVENGSNDELKGATNDQASRAAETDTMDVLP